MSEPPANSAVSVFAVEALIPLVAALVFAVYGLLTRYVGRQDAASVSFFWTGVAGAVVMTLIGLPFWEPMTGPDWGWMAVLCCTGALGHWLMIRAYELRSDITPYDAAYVALAESLGYALLTADARLARAPGIRCTVELLRI